MGIIGGTWGIVLGAIAAIALGVWISVASFFWR